MKSNKNYISEDCVFAWVAVFFIALGWLAFYLALVSRFSRWPLAIFIIASFLSAVIIIIKKNYRLKASSYFGSIFFFAIVIIIVYSFFTTPTIFSGRDQGSISEAAIRLAQNGELRFSTLASEEFFKTTSGIQEKYNTCREKWIKNPGFLKTLTSPFAEPWCQVFAAGKALNFPGFYYLPDGKLITHFPLPYIAWLAIFYSFFGLTGLVIANAVLFFIFLFSFYFLLAVFLKKINALLALVVIATSFPLFWFFKFTLSENMALAILWFGIWQWTLFLKERKKFSYFAAWTSFALLAFCRIEGLFVLIPFVLIIISNSSVRKFISQNKVYYLVLPIVFFLLFFLANFYVDLAFYKEMFRVVLDFGLKNSNIFQKNVWTSTFQLFQVFSLYGMTYFFILTPIAAIYFLFKKNSCQKMIPLIIVLPVAFYFFDPKISADHPWLLRRYVFALLPVSVFLSFLFLEEWLAAKNKKVFYALVILMLAINFPLLVIYGFYAENKNLLAETEILSRKISNNDLFLVDREASGDGWAMISGPLSFLYGKQTVYFFNSEDFAKIDTAKFSNIFLIIPDKKVEHYLAGPLGSKMTFVKNYSLPVRHLEYLPKNENRLPSKIENEINGKIFKITP